MSNYNFEIDNLLV